MKSSDAILALSLFAATPAMAANLPTMEEVTTDPCQARRIVTDLLGTYAYEMNSITNFVADLDYQGELKLPFVTIDMNAPGLEGEAKMDYLDPSRVDSAKLGNTTKLENTGDTIYTNERQKGRSIATFTVRMADGDDLSVTRTMRDRGISASYQWNTGLVVNDSKENICGENTLENLDDAFFGTEIQITRLSKAAIKSAKDAEKEVQ